MKKLSYLILFFSCLLDVGGIIGFVKAHSVASLVTSAIASFILAVGAVMALREKIQGLYLSALVILGLDVFFVYRFMLSKKFMPSGLMALLSTLMGVILFSYLTKRAKEA